MIDKWLYLEAETEATVSGRIDDTITSISTHSTQLQATIQNYKYFDDSANLDAGNTGIKILYGFILALSLLGLLASIILTCCTVVRVRLVIYCTCSFLLFFGIITFVLLIVLGIMIPDVAQFCAYADDKLTTEAGISYLF